VSLTGTGGYPLEGHKDSIKDRFKETKKESGVSSFSFPSSEHLEIQKRWFHGAYQLLYSDKDISKALLDSWVKPCFVVDYNDSAKLFTLGVMNFYAKEILINRSLDKRIEQGLRQSSGFANLKLELVVTRPPF